MTYSTLAVTLLKYGNFWTFPEQLLWIMQFKIQMKKTLDFISYYIFFRWKLYQIQTNKVEINSNETKMTTTLE